MDLADNIGQRRKTSFAGKVYMGEWKEGQRPTQLIPIGLVGEGSISLSEEVTNLPDTENPAGGSAHTMRSINDAIVEFKQHDFNKGNVARALYGEHVLTPAQTLVEAFSITAHGVMVPLAYLSAKGTHLTTPDWTPHWLIIGTALDQNQLIFTAVGNAQPYITITEPSTATASTTVGVLANRITIVPKHDGVSITATLQEVIDAIDASQAASALVTAEVVAGSVATSVVSSISETQLSGSLGSYYAANETSWTLDPTGSGLLIPKESNLPLDTQLQLAYDIPEQIRVDAMTGVSKEVSIICNQQNKANDDKPVRLWMFRVQFGPAATLSLFQKDYADLTIKGSVMKDTLAKRKSINGVATTTAESDYFILEMTA